MVDALRIEALNADFEDHVASYPGRRIDWTVEVEVMRALVASWRERGRALAKIRDNDPDSWEASVALAILKDGP